METTINLSQVLIILPILGAILGLIFRHKPKAFMLYFQGMVATELVSLIILSDFLAGSVTLPLSFIVVLAGACITLGRHLESTSPFDIFETFILMGLGLGFLLNPNNLGLIFLIGLFALLIVIQYRAKGFSDLNTRWVVGLYGTGIVFLSTSLSLSGQSQQVVLFLAYAMLLPLFPLHGAYLSLLNCLSGVLPAFLAVFLPVLGLHGLLPLLSFLPDEIKQVILFCAMLGVIIASLRGLVQIRISNILSQTALVFWSILWWYLCGSDIKPSAGIIFLSSAGFALCGLFLSGHTLKSRYGDLLVDQFGGLGSVMPRFSVLFVLLIMAGMGLPLFGVFSGFIAMAFSPSMTFSWSLAIILLAWFFASWRLPLLMQGTLFGKSNPNWIYRDLDLRETTALSFILIVLLILGLAPDAFFGLEHLDEIPVALMKAVR